MKIISTMLWIRQKLRDFIALYILLHNEYKHVIKHSNTNTITIYELHPQSKVNPTNILQTDTSQLIFIAIYSMIFSKNSSTVS